MMDSEPKRKTIMRFVRDKRGATSIEYGLFVALIAIVLIMALGRVYNAMDRNFGNVSGVTEKVNQQLEERTANSTP